MVVVSGGGGLPPPPLPVWEELVVEVSGGGEIIESELEVVSDEVGQGVVLVVAVVVEEVEVVSVQTLLLLL